MFKTNEGKTDRILRIVVGLLLLGAYFLTSGSSYHWLYLIGIVPLVTGLVGNCPVYSIVGISTCPVKAG